MIDAERVPVVVGTGQAIERHETVTALDLAARAADEAFALAPGLRSRVEVVSVVNVLSGTDAAPAAGLARRLGLAPRRTEVTTIGGNSPQWLVNRAASAIAAGELEVALVAGAEAQRSEAQRARAQRSEAPRPQDQRHETANDAPDPVVGDDRPGIGPAELGAGLVAPVHVYALFESVIAQRAGRTFAQQRAALGALLAPFTEVAASHPFAWFPEPRNADALATVTADNRLVAEPYPKRMCAVLGVDQGAAVLVTSLAAARSAGVTDGAMFVWSGAEASDVWFATARPDPGSSPALRIAAHGALEAAGLGVDDVDAFDVYSCFPCVVEMAIEALGVTPHDERGLTVTGGLPYFGGPGNDYSLHAVATMVQRLRHGGGTGLVSALGWYATKHAVGLYGAAPPPRGWCRADTGDAQRSIDASAVAVAHDGDAEGLATVVASTVAYGRDGAVSAAPVIARLEDGRHVAAAAEGDELAALAGTELVGSTVTVSGAPPRYRVGG